MLNLDGSTLEGGGQLVRVALSLSSICKIPIRITNIRAGRGPGSFYKGSRQSRGGRNGHGSRGTSSEGGKEGRGRSSDLTARASKKSAGGGGLKESHLAALTWLVRECEAEVEGAEVGSLEVMFRTSRRIGGTETRSRASDNKPEVIELKNPGSVWLIWQAIFPYIVFSLLDHRGGSPDEPAFRIRLKGGTNVPKSPSSEYMQQVFLPLCEMIGLPKVAVRVIRRGWTTGAPEIGEIEISVFHPTPPREGKQQKKINSINQPKTEQDGVRHNDEDKKAEKEGVGFHLHPFHLRTPEPFNILSISITTICGSIQTYSLLESKLQEALRSIPKFSNTTFPIHMHPSSSADSGDERRLYILLAAHLDGGCVLGRDYLGPGRKITNDSERKRMVDEAVGHVVRDFIREVERGSCVDEFAEDQLVIFQALAQGASRVDVGTLAGKARAGESGSLHTRTVRWVCNEMLGTKFDGVGGCEGGGLLRETGGEVTRRIGDLSVEGRL